MMSSSRRQFWIVLIISLLSIATGATFVVRQITGASDGARLQPGASALQPYGAVVSVLRPEPDGLQSGDLVVGVEGRSLESWAAGLFDFSNRLPPPQGEILRYEVVRAGQTLEVLVSTGPYPLGPVLAQNGGLIAFGVISLLIGGLVFVRRPYLPSAQILFLSVSGLAGSTAWSFGLTISDFTDGIGFWLFKLATLVFYALFWTAGFHFALLFPEPFRITEKRWFSPVLYGLPYGLIAVYLAAVQISAVSTLDWLRRWTPVEGLHAAVFLTATLFTYFLQFRRANGAEQKQQIRWVVFAAIVSGGTGLLLYLLPPFLGFSPLPANLIGLVVLPYPISIAIAVLRHNLFDIDTLVNRALVYGSLTAGTMLLYILIVGTVGNLLQGDQWGLLAFLATGMVAVLFQPLRDRVQRGVNRLMYGDRDDPYTVLAGLGMRLEETLAPADVLPTIVETVAEALKLPYAAIILNDNRNIAYGVLPSQVAPVAFSLDFQGENFGRLEVAPRAPDEPFRPREIELLQNLTRQVEVVVHNVRLNQDLRRSRRRLVRAREEERRRIRRDLHDGLGAQLASQLLIIDAVDRLIDRDPESARRLLRDMKNHSQTAVAEIRRLIYGLRPPVLDDLGLAEALRQEFRKIPHPSVEVNVQDDLPQLPAAIELAAYRILQEAVNNAVKHAGARECRVRVWLEPGTFLISVSDDGKGLPEGFRRGVGMHSMQERAEELGGRLSIMSTEKGTRIQAYLPLEEEHDD